jgi:hypothetical protein
MRRNVGVVHNEVGVEEEFGGDDDLMHVIHGVSLETSVQISNKGLLLMTQQKGINI